MANGLKIKRGDGTPVAGSDGSNGVWPYELAWDYTNNKLWINDNGTMREVSGSSGTITSVTGMTNNNVLTASGSTTISGESGLTFDGTLLHISKETSTTGTTGTTLLKLTNDVGSDLSQQKTFVDFTLLDSNGNETPQVRIGAEVGRNGDANSQEKEGSGAFVVYTNNADTASGDAGASLTERMRVDYQGNVGIGVANPTQPLHVNASGANGVVLKASDNANNSPRIFFEGTSTSAIFQEGNDFSFRTGATAGSSSGTERFKIDSSGDVSITSGSLYLPVAEKLYFGGGNHTYIGEDVNDRLRFFTGGAEYMRFTETGSGILGIYRDVYMGDNLKIHLGGSNDLQIFHNGTNSYGADNYTGHLIYQNRANDSDIIFKTDDGSGGVTTYIELDGSTVKTDFKKPISVEDSGFFPDSSILYFGTGNDLRIQHNGSNSFIQQYGTGGLYIDNTINDQSIYFRTDDGTGGITPYITLRGDLSKVVLHQDTILAATKKLYLDGGGDTYIHEPSANQLDIVVGGDNTFRTIANRVYINSTGANGLVINNDEGTLTNSGRIFFETTNYTTAIMQENDDLSFRTGATTGSSSGTERFKINSNGTVTVVASQVIGGALQCNFGAVFNETANDSNFRVESVGNPHMISVDASTNRVGIGTGAPTKELDVAGSVRITGDSIFGPNNNNSKAFIKARNGYSSATTPDYTWYYNDQCGIYHPAGNTIGFSAGGEKVKIGTYGLYSADDIYIAHGGSDYSPGLQFMGGSNTPGANEYENAKIAYFDNSGSGHMRSYVNRNAGSHEWYIGGTRMFSFDNSGNLVLRSDGSSQGASIQRVGGIQFTWDRDTYGNSNVHSIRTDSDDIILSSYDDVTINLDSNNNDGASTFDIRQHSSTKTGGELLFQINQSGISYTMGASQVGNGSAAAPSLSFYNDTDLGFYRNGANNMRFTAGNAIRGTWNGDGLVLNGGSLGVNVAASTAADGRIDAGNDIVAYSSDKRLKENIRPINNALDKVNKLSGFIYNWNKLANEQAGFDMKEDLVGVYAQDVEEVLPEAVKLAPFDNDGEDNSKSGENYLTVQYEKMVPLLIEAIKEQQQQINELKEKLNG